MNRVETASGRNLAIVRLAYCCELRASEIGGLTLGDVRVGIARPHLLIRAEHAKRNRPRRIPLWWDAGTGSTTATTRALGATIRSSAHCRRRLSASPSITTSSAAGSTQRAASWAGIGSER